jgi:hypothetical protein
VRTVGLLQHPSNRKTAPDHLVIVIPADTVNDGRPQSNGFQIVSHQPDKSSALRGLASARVLAMSPGP